MYRIMKKVMKYVPEESDDYKRMEALIIFLTNTLQSINK